MEKKAELIINQALKVFKYTSLLTGELLHTRNLFIACGLINDDLKLYIC